MTNNFYHIKITKVSVLEHKHTSKQGTHTNVDAFISDECSVTQNDQNEITKAKEEGGASQDPTQVAGVTNVESQKPPEAQSVEEKGICICNRHIPHSFFCKNKFFATHNLHNLIT